MTLNFRFSYLPAIALLMGCFTTQTLWGCEAGEAAMINTCSSDADCYSAQDTGSNITCSGPKSCYCDTTNQHCCAGSIANATRKAEPSTN